MTKAKDEIKHKSMISPFECPHCGYIWYGHAGRHPGAPDVVLCSHGLEAYLMEHHAADLMGNAPAVLDYSRAWIQDKSQKPFPRLANTWFHKRSVPAWMRSAINQGLVKPNDTHVYVVYSTGKMATRAEIVGTEGSCVDMDMELKNDR